MKIQIDLASSKDAARLSAALRQLAIELGDPWPNNNTEALARALTPSHRSLWAVLANQGEQTCGVAAFMPYFSTYRGAPGLMVSDLWVHSDQRGLNLGPRLLAAAGRCAQRQWGASFLKLSAYQSNPRAQTFYLRLGFEAMKDERNFSLHDHFDSLLENYP